MLLYPNTITRCADRWLYSAAWIPPAFSTSLFAFVSQPTSRLSPTEPAEYLREAS
jgi:hypothetical protein